MAQAAAKSEAQDLVAKRLRTGEIALWDPKMKSILLIAPVEGESTVVARIIRGASLKALEEVLGPVVVLG